MRLLSPKSIGHLLTRAQFYNDFAVILMQFRDACKEWVDHRRDEIRFAALWFIRQNDRLLNSLSFPAAPCHMLWKSSLSPRAHQPPHPAQPLPRHRPQKRYSASNLPPEHRRDGSLVTEYENRAAPCLRQTRANGKQWKCPCLPLVERSAVTADDDLWFSSEVLLIEQCHSSKLTT